MSKFKIELTGVNLAPCCYESLKDIQERIEIGKYLQRSLIPLVFVSLFISPSDSMGRGGALTTAYSIYGTDWEMLVRAVITVPDIVKNRVRLISDMERLKHHGPLREFWDGVSAAFE